MESRESTTNSIMAKYCTCIEMRLGEHTKSLASLNKTVSTRHISRMERTRVWNEWHPGQKDNQEIINQTVFNHQASLKMVNPEVPVLLGKAMWLCIYNMIMYSQYDYIFAQLQSIAWCNNNSDHLDLLFTLTAVFLQEKGRSLYCWLLVGVWMA